MSWRSKTAVTSENIDNVHYIVLADRWVKVRELAEAISISIDKVHFILLLELDTKKLCAWWVLRLFIVEQKRNRMRTSAGCLQVFKKYSTESLRRFVTMDETWIHPYSLEVKEQSKKWTGWEKSAPEKAKSVPSTGKVMASVFWDAKGNLFIDYLLKEKTITGKYCTSLVERLKTAIAEKRPGMAMKTVLFHQDNVPLHSSRVTEQKLAELRFELLSHQAYSLHLAPSICSGNSVLFELDNNLCAMQRPSRRSTTILKGLKKTTLGKESRTWRNVKPSALNFEEIISKNTVRYKTQIVVFHIEPSYL